MARSFLNMVSVDGKLCRIAEFGFHADIPSFDGNSIVFRIGESFRRIDLATGMMTYTDKPSAVQVRTSPDGRYTVSTGLASDITNGIGYVHLILRDNEKSTETVLTRFMGNENSLGAVPISDDSKSIVFFGYPEEELG